MIKTASHITIKQIRLAVIFSVLAFFSAVFLFVAVNKAGASFYIPNGITPGFSGASCPGAASDWVAVRIYTRDSTPPHPLIAGSFNVECKFDFKSNSVDANGCGSAGGSTYFCEGPDPTHPTFSWYAIRCSAASAGSGTTVCMGGCNMPFRFNASAPGYYDSDTWLENHGANSNFNLYPEGNINTANYTVYLDKKEVPPDPPPTNTLHVRSSGAGGSIQIGGSQPGTGGWTPYDVVTQNNISTWLNAPKFGAVGEAKKFWKWTGCESARPEWNRDCDAVVVAGQVQTVKAHYVDNLGWIQGYKVRMPGNKNVDPPAGQTVRLNGGSPTTANPYAYNNLKTGSYTVSVNAPAGWKVGYTLCYKKKNCHGKKPTMASSVVVNVPAGSYADLWWHYYPLDLVVKSVVVTNGTEFHVGDEVLVDVTVENTKGGTAGAFWVEVCPSGNKPLINCPNAGTGKWTYKEKVTSLASGVSVVETFSFPAPDPGSYPKTYTLIARADLPDPGKVLEAIEYTNNWGKATYKVIGPPPWFQTEVGDVGSIGSIEPDDPPQKAGEYSADYLVMSNGLIDKFTSFRKWLVPGYTGINVRPAPESGSIYSAFFNKYKPDTSNPIGSIGEIPNTGGERVYFVNGSLVVPGGGVSYDKEPAVVFVKEHMEINGNIQIDEPTGLIFVVNGYVRVKKKVRQADGVYIFDEDYEVRSKGNSNEKQLEVNGSLLGAFDSGEFLLERDFRSADSWEKPTELFIFEPKYLWLFRDTLGDVKTRFEEVSP